MAEHSFYPPAWRVGAALVCSGLAACSPSPDADELFVGAITPATGPTAGNTAVLVSGQGFVQGAVVSFGGELATDVDVIDGETIAARTPAGAPGSVPVVVELPAGDSFELPDGFLYTDEFGCRIVSHAPAFDETGVFVTAAVDVTWSAPIDPASAEAAVQLKVLGAASISTSFAMIDDSTARLQPDSSLHFWEHYALIVNEGVAAASGDACAPEAVAFSTLEPVAVPGALRPAPAHASVHLGNVTLTVSPDYRGLQIWDTTDASDVKLVGDVRTEVGLQNITLGPLDRAYAAAGSGGVIIFDVSDPLEPTVVGVAGTPGFASDAVAFESGGVQYLYVADNDRGVRVLDVTELGGPKDLGFVNASGAPVPQSRALSKSGDIIAIAENAAGFSLISVANPAQPAVLATRASEPVPQTFGSTPPILDVVVAGTNVYAAVHQQGIQSFDVTNPTIPTFHEHLVTPVGLCANGCADVLADLHLDGNSLFGAVTTAAFRVALDGSGGMTLDATLPTGGRIWRVNTTSSHLWISAEAGLLAFEKAAPSGTGPLPFDGEGHGVARGVAVAGGVAYVAASARGLQTYSLADPAAPELVNQILTSGTQSDVGAISVDLFDGLLVLNDGRGGAVLFDVSVPDAPVQAGAWQGNTDAVVSSELDGNTLFVCQTNSGLTSLDIADPSQPTVVGSLPAGALVGCNDFALLGSYLYVAAGTGLGVIDVSDPTAPALAGLTVLPPDDIFGSLAIYDGHVLATGVARDYEGINNRANRLAVFDITSDPTAPALVFQSDKLPGATHVSVVGDKAFVTTGAGVAVYDLRDVTAPVAEGTFATPGSAHALSFSDAFGYVTQRGGGLLSVFLGDLPGSGSEAP